MAAVEEEAPSGVPPTGEEEEKVTGEEGGDDKGGAEVVGGAGANVDGASSLVGGDGERGGDGVEGKPSEAVPDGQPSGEGQKSGEAEARGDGVGEAGVAEVVEQGEEGEGPLQPESEAVGERGPVGAEESNTTGSQSATANNHDGVSQEELDAAATKVQAGFRGYQARKEVAGKRAEAAAPTEEEPVIASTETDKVVPNGETATVSSNEGVSQEELDAAATKVQSGFRGYQVRKEVATLRAARGTAQGVESPAVEGEVVPTVEGETGDDVPGATVDDAGLPQEELDAAATKVQAGFRGYQARKEVATLRSIGATTTAGEKAPVNGVEETATVEGETGDNAQRAASNSAGLPQDELDAAATKVQAGFRGYQARKEVASLRAVEGTPNGAEAPAVEEEDGTSAEGQAEDDAPLDILKSPEELNAAATKVQAGFRGYKARKEVATLRSTGATTSAGEKAPVNGVEETATVEGETGDDAQLAASNSAGLPQDELDAAATKVQAGFRGYQARKEVASLRAAEGTPNGAEAPAVEGEQGTAAQGQAENDAPLDILNSPEEPDAAATKDRAGFRGYKARKEVAGAATAGIEAPTSNVEKISEADDIPVDAAGLPQEELDAAATKVQAGFRGYQARKEVAALRSSAVYVEETPKGEGEGGEGVPYDVYDAAGSPPEELDAAATKVQAGFRGYQARKEVAAMRSGGAVMTGGQVSPVGQELVGEDAGEGEEVAALRGEMGKVENEDMAREADSPESVARRGRAGASSSSVGEEKEGGEVTQAESKPSRIPRGASQEPRKPKAAGKPKASPSKRRAAAAAAAAPSGPPAWNSSPKVRRPVSDPAAPEDVETGKGAPAQRKAVPPAARRSPARERSRNPQPSASEPQAQRKGPQSRTQQHESRDPSPEKPRRAPKQAKPIAATTAQPSPPAPQVSHSGTPDWERGPPSDEGERGLGGNEGVREQQEVSRPRADDDDSGTAAQLVKEQRARAELEDMLLRIERHFKLEQAARKKAEEELEEVRAGEAAARAEVDAEHARFEAYAAEMDQRNAEMHADAASVDAMRQDYEEQLADLRHQLQEAQQVARDAEARGRHEVVVDRQRIESEVQQRLAPLQMELDHTRMELMQRTATLTEELQRWRWHAENSAAAMLEAKADVMERKRDLDSAKEKMDGILDKLMFSREKGIELSSAIDQQLHRAAQPPAWMMAGMGGNGGRGNPMLMPPPAHGMQPGLPPVVGASPPAGYSHSPQQQQHHQPHPPRAAGVPYPSSKKASKASPSGHNALPNGHVPQPGGYYRGPAMAPPPVAKYHPGGGYGGPPVHLPAIDAHRSPQKSKGKSKAKPPGGDRWAEAQRDNARLAHAAGRFG